MLCMLAGEWDCGAMASCGVIKQTCCVCGARDLSDVQLVMYGGGRG